MHKPNFILREITSFMNKFEVVLLFRSFRKYLSNLFDFVFVQLYRHCLLNISFRLVMFTIGL